MKINTKWHAQNKMPQNPTLDERIEWHIAHARNCSCREPVGKILKETQKKAK